MRRPKTSLATAMISPASFTRGGRDKTKLNWFAYELALAIFDESTRLAGRRLRRANVGGDALAEFSTRAAEDLRAQVLRRLSGELEVVVMDCEFVRQHLRTLDNATTDRIVDAMMAAWDGLLSTCECCATACITNRGERTAMFDDGPASVGGDLCLARPGDLRDHPLEGDIPLDAPVLVRHAKRTPREGTELDRWLALVDGWCASFQGSPQHSRLSPDEQEDCGTVVSTFARLMFSELGLSPEEWEAEAVEHCCLRVLPGKVVSDPGFFEEFAPVLAAFLEWAGLEGLVEDGQALSAMVGPLGERIVASASDPEQWAGSKSIAMRALGVGMDPVDDAWMVRLLTKQIADGPPPPRGSKDRRDGRGPRAQ